MTSDFLLLLVIPRPLLLTVTVLKSMKDAKYAPFKKIYIIHRVVISISLATGGLLAFFTQSSAILLAYTQQAGIKLALNTYSMYHLQ
jgi:hypothetical protein